MEREGHERQRESDRREDPERARGPPERRGASPPCGEGERHEEREKEPPYVEEVPRLCPRADLAAPVPRRRRKLRPERTREERPHEGDSRRRQENVLRERSGSGREPGRPRPEPKDPGQEEEKARVN